MHPIATIEHNTPTHCASKLTLAWQIEDSDDRRIVRIYGRCQDCQPEWIDTGTSLPIKDGDKVDAIVDRLLGAWASPVWDLQDLLSEGIGRA